MIIKRIYIDNFGGLSNFEYDFANDLNTISKPNGFGKTTLATFIKAMFYGMPNKNTKDLIKNERKKYYPWSNGKFGGFIEFVAQDGEYRLERYFGRTEKDDTVMLYDAKTNRPINFDMEIGEKYFQIDADGFAKTIFINEENNVKFENSSIVTLLSNNINTTNDFGDFDKAIEVLDDKRKYYLKANGSGVINQLKLEISEIKNQIETINHTKEVVKVYKDNIDYLTGELERLEQEKHKFGDYVKSNQRQLELIAKTEHLKSLQKDIEAIKSKLNDYSIYFAKYLPTEQEISQMVTLENEVNILKDKLDKLMPNENDYLFYQNKKQEFEKINAKNIENAINLTLNSGTKTSRIGVKILLFVLSLLSALSGVYFLNNSLIVGISLIAFALIFCVSGLLIKQHKKEFDLSQIQNILPNIKLSNGNCLNELFELKNNFNKWKNLDNYLKQTGEEIEKNKNELEEKSNKLNYFLINFNNVGANYNNVQMIKSNFDTYNILISQLREKQSSLDKFLSDNSFIDIESKIEVENIDAQIVQNEQMIESNKNKLFELKQKLKMAQETLSMQNEYERELLALQVKYDEAVNDYEMLLKTMEFLKNAKENLNVKYLAPMQKYVNTYLNELDTELVQEAVLDVDLNTSVQVGGELRVVDYFSNGYKKLLNFCTRLAFIKTVYQSEKPFIVIDDAFLGLDDVNLKKVNILINKLSNDYQIIYLTCKNNGDK